jgi:hypothetical protein
VDSSTERMAGVWQRLCSKCILGAWHSKLTVGCDDRVLLLCQPQVGQLVAVDPKAMFLSVLQLVLAPVLIGCTVNSIAPKLVGGHRAGRGTLGDACWTAAGSRDTGVYAVPRLCGRCEEGVITCTCCPALQVALVRPFMPLAATAVVVLIVGSMISCNVAIMGQCGAKVGARPQLLSSATSMHIQVTPLPQSPVLTSSTPAAQWEPISASLQAAVLEVL